MPKMCIFKDRYVCQFHVQLYEFDLAAAGDDAIWRVRCENGADTACCHSTFGCPAPRQTSSQELLSFDNSIYVFGGVGVEDDDDVAYRDVWRFSFDNFKWTPICSPYIDAIENCSSAVEPFSHEDATVARIESKLVALDTGRAQEDTELFTASFQSDSSFFVEQLCGGQCADFLNASNTSYRYSTSLAVIELPYQVAILFGGQSDATSQSVHLALNDIWIFGTRCV